MKYSGAQQLLDQVDTAIKNINGFANTTPLEQSYLAKFLVVFISGIYEEVIEGIINKMIEIRSSNNPEISRFMGNYLRHRFQNPNMKNICQLLKQFNNEWTRIITALPQNARVALDNIVDNKNGIAHGQTVVLTLNDVQVYYNNSRIVIEKIDELLL